MRNFPFFRVLFSTAFTPTSTWCEWIKVIDLLISAYTQENSRGTFFLRSSSCHVFRRLERARKFVDNFLVRGNILSRGKASTFPISRQRKSTRECSKIFLSEFSPKKKLFHAHKKISLRLCNIRSRHESNSRLVCMRKSEIKNLLCKFRVESSVSFDQKEKLSHSNGDFQFIAIVVGYRNSLGIIFFIHFFAFTSSSRKISEKKYLKFL